MAEPDIAEEIRHSVQERGPTDIVIGIPSFNNAATIGHVVSTVKQGLGAFFPSLRSIIIHTDGGSFDGSSEQALHAVQDSASLLQVPYRLDSVNAASLPSSGIPSKLNALRTIFLVAKMLAARVCAVVGPDIPSITPDWIRSLVQPVWEERCDYVSPFYACGKFDGTINNSIVYPITRALYGKRIRFPMGSECCFSSRILDHYIKQDTGDGNAASFGIEIRIATRALCGGFRAAQSFLGLKIHDSSQPVSDLSSMVRQILGVVFTEAENNARVWQRIRGSETVPLYGHPEVMKAASLEVHPEEMIDSYKIGFKNLIELWSMILPPATLLALKKLAQCTNNNFVFSDTLWVHIIYDFAVAFHLKSMNRDHLLSALTPLYLGWVVSFLLQMQRADAARVDERIEELCTCYEMEKPYLISHWRWPDRFNP